MADPEQIYSEVLAEEQAKGSATPVAEGRAKAARQRAVHGSPHPKEAKWWPGSQPQFEGGEAAAPAEDEAAEEEAAPVEEAPAAEVETEAAPAPAEPVAAPQEVAPAQPAAPAEPAAPAAATAPVPAAAATAAATGTATLPSGVTHGTPAGNRLRPEDSVATDYQFDAQKAMLQRRKMIDELVASGVPAVSVAPNERKGSGAGMLLLYLLIPLLAIGFLVSNKDDLAGPSDGGEAPIEGEGGEGGGGGLEITAANVAFDNDALTIPADGGDLVFKNEDTAEHNVAIYEDDSAETDIFVGDTIPGGQEVTYAIPAHEPGEYYFQCDLHPTMNGTATFE